jgi:PAS domain S-box-containing protein
MAATPCVLIVDDEEGQRKSLSLILKKKGYEVESAGTGKEALNKAKSRFIDLVLLDIKLPDIDGIDLIARLKDLNHDLPVIMISGFASVENTVRSMNSGASAYLVKPISNDEMLVKIQDLLERQELIREKRQAEGALQESEAKFRTLFESAGDAIFVMNSTVFLDCNRSTEVIFGCSRDQIIGHSPVEFSPERQPDGRFSREKAKEKIDTALLGEPQFFEWVHTRYNHTPFDAEVTLNRIVLKDHYYLQAIVRDVTGRKQADELARVLAQMSDDAPASIVVHDFEGKILYANEETFRLHGYTRDEYLAKDLHEIDVPESEQLIAERMQQVRDAGVAEFDVQHFRKDGSKFPLHVNVKIVEWGKRKVLLSIATDLTERKRAEQALHESEQRYRNIITGTQAGYFQINTQGIFKSVNQAWLRMHRFSSEAEVIGKHFSITQVDADQHAAQESVKLILHGETILNGEFSRRMKDGSTGYHSFSASPVVHDGTIVGLEGFLIDTTERKQAEEQLKHFNEVLERGIADRTEKLNASLEEKVVLLREVHHRVKNNLQILISLLNLQSRTFNDPQVIEALKESTQRIRAMWIAHEKLYSGSDLARIDYISYLSSLAKSQVNFYRLGPHKVTLEITGENIMLDINTAIPLGLIINELLSNALKHAFPGNRKGTIRINVRKTEGRLEISLADDGVGLPEGFDYTTSPSFGLRLVHILIEQLQGTIELDRTAETTFTIVVKEKQ